MKHKYPLLRHVNEIFSDVDLSKTLLIACQHLLGTQYQMFKILFQMGLDPENCFVIGKNYSTNLLVYQQLKELGCHVDKASIEYSPTEAFDDWFAKKIKGFLGKVLSRIDLDHFEKIVILDDGGFLIYEVANSTLPQNKVEAVEQTSSGWHLLKDEVIDFKVFFVARSYPKLRYETPFVTKLCYERVLEHLEERELEEPKILIIGNRGHIGSSLEARFSKQFKTLGFDVVFDPNGKLYSLSDYFGDQLKEFDVVIGGTGSLSVSAVMLGKLKKSVSLISVSSADREFPSLLFRKEKSGLHQNHFQSERCLVNSGFPITFYGNYHEMPANQIEITCALLMFGVLRASLKENDERTMPHYVAAIASRLSDMYFKQIGEKDHVYTTAAL